MFGAWIHLIYKGLLFLSELSGKSLQPLNFSSVALWDVKPCLEILEVLLGMNH